MKQEIYIYLHIFGCPDYKNLQIYLQEHFGIIRVSFEKF